MIYPLSDRELLRVYRCGACKKAFAHSGHGRSGCAVLHEPGSCCHHGEAELSDEQLEAFAAITTGLTVTWGR